MICMYGVEESDFLVAELNEVGDRLRKASVETVQYTPQETRYQHEIPANLKY